MFPGACIIKHYGFVNYVAVVTGKKSVIHKKISSYEILKMLYHKTSDITESVLCSDFRCRFRVRPVYLVSMQLFFLL